MGAGDLELLDLTYTDATEDDQPRLKVGDLASGAGVGQDCAFLCTSGFGGMPNPPDANGGAATAVCWTPANDRFVIACADNRYNGKAGALAAGDCWCASNCDAAFLLKQSANKIGFLAIAQGMSLSLDAANQEINAEVGHARTLVGTTGATMLYNDGIVNAFAHATGSGVVLSYTAAAVTCSITLGPGGAIAIVAPGGLTVNGTPVP